MPKCVRLNEEKELVREMANDFVATPSSVNPVCFLNFFVIFICLASSALFQIFML